MTPAGGLPAAGDAAGWPLAEVWPELADELAAAGHPALAATVPTLQITGRCPCADEFCQAFYTGPGPGRPRSVQAAGAGSADADPTTIELDVDHGLLAVDVVDGRITFVECLYRHDLGRPGREDPGRADKAAPAAARETW